MKGKNRQDFLLINYSLLWIEKCIWEFFSLLVRFVGMKKIKIDLRGIQIINIKNESRWFYVTSMCTLGVFTNVNCLEAKRFKIVCKSVIQVQLYFF